MQAILGVSGEVDGEEVFLNRIADVAVFKVLGDTNTSLAGLVHLSQYAEIVLRRGISI